MLAEEADEWFEGLPPDGSPFMSITAPARAGVEKKVPAVCHVDGSSRLQTVEKEAAPLYHRYVRFVYASPPPAFFVLSYFRFFVLVVVVRARLPLLSCLCSLASSLDRSSRSSSSSDDLTETTTTPVVAFIGLLYERV